MPSVHGLGRLHESVARPTINVQRCPEESGQPICKRRIGQDNSCDSCAAEEACCKVLTGADTNIVLGCWYIHIVLCTSMGSWKQK